MKRRDMLLSTPLAALAGCSGSNSNPLGENSAAAPDGVVDITDEMKNNVQSSPETGKPALPDPDPLAHIVVETMSTLYELNFTKYDFGQLKLSGHAKCDGGRNGLSTDIGGVLILDTFLGFCGTAPDYGQLFSVTINLQNTSTKDMIYSKPHSKRSFLTGYDKLIIHDDVIMMLYRQAIKQLYGD